MIRGRELKDRQYRAVTRYADKQQQIPEVGDKDVDFHYDREWTEEEWEAFTYEAQDALLNAGALHLLTSPPKLPPKMKARGFDEEEWREMQRQKAAQARSSASAADGPDNPRGIAMALIGVAQLVVACVIWSEAASAIHQSVAGMFIIAGNIMIVGAFLSGLLARIDDNLGRQGK